MADQTSAVSLDNLAAQKVKKVPSRPVRRLRVCLINMPFVSLRFPSLGLTQLQSTLRKEFGTRVDVDVLYLSVDVAVAIGVSLYSDITSSLEHHTTGVAEWLFRHLAFPNEPDNQEQYFARFYPGDGARARQLRARLLDARGRLDGVLDASIRRHTLDHADVVGFTSTFTQNIPSMAMARKLKARHPNIITVMGGANCETPMGRRLHQEFAPIDFVFSGPALESFVQFIHHVMDGELTRCGEIQGVFSRSGRRSARIGGPELGEERTIDDPIELDYGPFLDSLEAQLGDTHVRPTLLFETSRGCWWGERAHCTFCGLNGLSMGFRPMRPDLAVAQFESLFGYVDRCARLDAVDNILPKSYLKDVFPRLDTPDSMTIFYEVKSDLSEQEVAELARARVRLIQPGIESLATSTLKLMKKGSTAFQNLRLLKYCLLYDVAPLWNLLVGFPGETDSVYRKYSRDLPRLVHLPPPSGVYPVRFDRYSPYFDRAAEYGLDLRPLDYYELIYPFGEDAIGEIAYYFADRNWGADYAIAMAEWIGRLQPRVEEWREAWRGSGGLRPSLYFERENGEVCIRDSREGALRSIPAGVPALDILDHVAYRAATPAQVAAALRLPEAAVVREIQALSQRGFLFEESGRVMSLVLDRKPAVSREFIENTVSVSDGK